MFYSIKELVQQADSDFQGNVAELMIRTEFELTGREREEVILLMERNLEVMKASVELGLSEKKSRSGLTGGDAAKLDHYIKKGKTLSDFTVLSALPAVGVAHTRPILALCSLTAIALRAADKTVKSDRVFPFLM